MNTGARLGLGVKAGYPLGRFHKMKWALTLAAIAGHGQLPGGKGGLLQQGAKLLSSSPEVTKLTDEMRDRLADAAKAASLAAVSSKISSPSARITKNKMPNTTTAATASPIVVAGPPG